MKSLSIVIIWSLYKFWPLLVFTVFVLVILAVLVPASKRTSVVVGVGILLFILSMVSGFFLRPFIVGFLTNHFGEVAQGKVISTTTLSRRHNENRVSRSHIIYKTVDGQLIETFFDTDDFNVYPFSNKMHYPGVGTDITLKYIPNLPQYVIILKDMQANECAKLRLKMQEVQNKLQFDPGNEVFLRELEEVREQINRQGC